MILYIIFNLLIALFISISFTYIFGIFFLNYQLKDFKRLNIIINLLKYFSGFFLILILIMVVVFFYNIQFTNITPEKITLLFSIPVIIIGIFEYKQNRKEKKIQNFFEMNRRFNENWQFQEIFHILDAIYDTNIKNSDNNLHDYHCRTSEYPEKVHEIALYDHGVKEILIGFFEELEVLIRNNILDEMIVHNFFGYYALLCYNGMNSDIGERGFWENAAPESPYWSVYRDFVERMMRCESTKEQNNDQCDIIF